MKSCTQCSSARQYCSKRCFKRDWGEYGHRDECRLFADNKFDMDDSEEMDKLPDVTLKLSKEAKVLHEERRYKEAIAKFSELKVTAIRIRDQLHKRQVRETREESKKCVLPSHFKGLEDFDPDLANDLKVRYFLSLL